MKVLQPIYVEYRSFDEVMITGLIAGLALSVLSALLLPVIFPDREAGGLMHRDLEDAQTAARHIAASLARLSAAANQLRERTAESESATPQVH